MISSVALGLSAFTAICWLLLPLWFFPYLSLPSLFSSFLSAYIMSLSFALPQVTLLPFSPYFLSTSPSLTSLLFWHLCFSCWDSDVNQMGPVLPLECRCYWWNCLSANIGYEGFKLAQIELLCNWHYTGWWCTAIPGQNVTGWKICSPCQKVFFL